MKSLIIENDQLTLEDIVVAFKFRWPDIEIISTVVGTKGPELVEVESPDIVILDLDIPDKDGMAILREIRLFSNVPIILLSRSTESFHIIKGLELGADDYISKPFEPGVLVARVNNVLRHGTISKSRREERLAYGGLVIDPANHEVIYKGKTINLSPTEWRFFYCLVRNPGTTVSYVELWEKAWNSKYQGDTSTIRTCVWRLRAKLGDSNECPKIIVGEYGLGYRFVAPK